MKINLTKHTEKYILSLKQQDKDLVVSVINNFRTHGTKSIFYKPLINGVFELKADTDSHWHRVLGKFDKTTKPNEAVLTNAFAKTTNKTPNSEIELADSRMKTYLKNKT